MRGMNSASVDLIDLDPPFYSKANYAAPIGSEAAGAEFRDTWSLNDVDIAWLDLIKAKHLKLWRVIQAAMTDSDKSYLIHMATRLLEMRRLLKSTGLICSRPDWGETMTGEEQNALSVFCNRLQSRLRTFSIKCQRKIGPWIIFVPVLTGILKPFLTTDQSESQPDKRVPGD